MGRPVDSLVRNNPLLSTIYKAKCPPDTHDSETYLSDTNGRRVTPRITADLSIYENKSPVAQQPLPKPRGRGRPPKISLQEQDARDLMSKVIANKKRVGGPGIDRGGATFVNEKRRRGFSEDDLKEERIVDAET